MRFARVLAAFTPLLLHALSLPDGIAFRTAPSNSVLVGKTAIYGIPLHTTGVSRILLTHARRDIVFPPRLPVVVPASERELFEKPELFWAALEKDRFHDYAQRGTKVPVQPFSIERAVSDGDSIDGIRVVATPGYTTGAVSYIIERGGKRIACTGDLIYGDGQLFDLYSLQDAVPDAKARGYHGYAARAVDLIASLRRIAALKPDIILPARGPAIEHPQKSIGRLIGRLQLFLKSHFEVDALRWYWGDDNHKIRSRAVERAMDIMPMAEQSKLPDYIRAIGNSRLIVSRSGSTFLVDAGYSKLIPVLRERKAKVDGIWITHYHDDHTDYINDVMKEFGPPVYFTERMAEVMQGPAAFRLPCLTTRPVPRENAKRDGDKLRWHEWEFTFSHFPGQTLYHGGLLAKRDDGAAYLFTGDSFTPSGMDDYCMQNRVFLRPGEGYDLCLRRIGELPQNTWLLNQHVEPMFRYSPAQVARMRTELTTRSEVLKQLSPWPDINYMLDESWARIHPYGSEAHEGDVVALELRILNHAPGRQKYDVTWNPPAGWSILDSQTTVTLNAREEGSVRAKVRAGRPGLHVLTADVAFGRHKLTQWTEGLIRVR